MICCIYVLSLAWASTLHFPDYVHCVPTMSSLQHILRRLVYLVACCPPILPVLGLTFNATYGAVPAPFKIDVSPAFIARTKLKASLTRYAMDMDQPDFADGPPQHNVSTVRDYWASSYDWASVQRGLNAKYVIH